ncbi:hypothetical protein [Cytobacillus firmus]|uniref:hypothetical protein n=1 Tax=Cytobacillus TaxID=2675230 RepID=UPI0010651B50|nr:hypothetical protein [Cytobacillus firmus]
MPAWFGQREQQFRLYCPDAGLIRTTSKQFGLCCPNVCLVRTTSTAIWTLLSECVSGSNSGNSSLAITVQMQV